ncbi:tetratricopeptide repeat protein [bacterium]|nr:tetratricopeptide repeat protein [bacterium]
MPQVEDIVNVGFSLHQEGKLEEAENAYHEALRLDNKNAEVYNLIGVLKLQQGEVDEAVEYVERAVEISAQSYFYETLFQAYIRQQSYEKIIKNSSFVLELFKDNFTLLFNVALAYKNLHQNKEAIKFYEKALNVNPTSYQAWFNLANVYSIEAETENALSAMQVCKKLRPKDGETRYFLSLALMRVKNYDKGLKYFENRVSKEVASAVLKKTYPNKFREDNEWKGENIKNKTILVYYEAGFGDVIMFSRYLPIVKDRCKKLILMVQKPLSPLIMENLHLGVDEIIDTFIPESNIDFDCHCALLSLPYVLKLKNDEVFAYANGYLKADDKKTEEYRKKYFDNDKIKVGIKWQGNTYFDKDRVIPAEMFKPLMSIKNTQYYSFQTFEGSENITTLDGIIDIGKDLIDFSQTAAALKNLDLVICNDTSLAHLAGAMRIPCWILLPYDVNWRWHTDLSVCDWYESVRLFRQKSIGDWQSVFDEVLNEMKP